MKSARTSIHECEAGVDSLTYGLGILHYAESLLGK